MRFRLLPLALLLATPAPAAPVPKAKPRDGVIMVAVNSQPTHVRLYQPDGTLIRERSFENVCDCSLSPDGQRVSVCIKDDTVKVGGYDVFVVDTAADGKELGEPIARGFYHPRTAWAPDGKTLFAGNFDPPPGGSGLMVPTGATACDVTRRTAAADERLKGRIVVAVSPNGKRFLTGRVDQKPKTEFRTDLLDRETLKPTDIAADDVTFRNFLDDDTLVGVRLKKGGQGNEYEFFLLDVAAKNLTPVPLPKEATGKTASVHRVFPAPDDRRMLVLWSEEAEKPADWTAADPCRPHRVTVCDRDGTNAKTILRPEVKSANDYHGAKYGWIDWR